MASPGVIDSVVAATLERFGRIDILVNNAALATGTRFEQLTAEEWRLAMEVNLTVPFLLTKAVLPTIPNVVDVPPPDVEIITFTERGPVLAVRPYVHTDHYWQVYFATNRAIRDTFGAAGYPVPEAAIRYRTV